MKRMLALFLLLLPMLLCTVIPVSASSNLPLVVDEAELLTQVEIEQLEAKAQDIRKTYAMDAVILTVDSLNEKYAQDYADDYYDDHGYGVGTENSGALFLLAMEEREWYISTCGDVIYALTDYSIQQLGEAAAGYFAAGKYYDGFDTYLEELPVYLSAYQRGSPIDGYADYSGDYDHGDRQEIIYYEENDSPSIVLSLLAGVLVAGIVILIMRSSMNTKRQQHGAASYLKKGSFYSRAHQDMFLYSNVSKTRKQEPKSTGGGSSVRRSSSGTRHGGGGGKF